RDRCQLVAYVWIAKTVEYGVHVLDQFFLGTRHGRYDLPTKRLLQQAARKRMLLCFTDRGDAVKQGNRRKACMASVQYPHLTSTVAVEVTGERYVQLGILRGQQLLDMYRPVNDKEMMRFGGHVEAVIEPGLTPYPLVILLRESRHDPDKQRIAECSMVVDP